MDPIQVVLQFLQEEGYTETFDSLVKESNKQYNSELLQAHSLRQLLGELDISLSNESLRRLFSGAKITSATKASEKKTFSSSPISMISIDNSYFICSFNDQTIAKIDIGGNVISQIQPKLSTVLCFERKSDNLVYFGTMNGTVGILDLITFEVVKTISLQKGMIIGMAMCGKNTLFAGTRNGFIALIDNNKFELINEFKYDGAVVGICCVSNGVIYAIQNDPMFHFRKEDDLNTDILIPTNPNVFATCGMEIRDMVNCPTDKSIFVALTGLCKAYVYRLPNNNVQNIEILKVLNNFSSDGLTQPKLLWESTPTLMATSDDQTVVGVNIENDTIAFKLNEWNKATRCLTVLNDFLFVGAFDKSISTFKLNKE